MLKVEGLVSYGDPRFSDEPAIDDIMDIIKRYFPTSPNIESAPIIINFQPSTFNLQLLKLLIDSLKVGGVSICRLNLFSATLYSAYSCLHRPNRHRVLRTKRSLP